MHAYLFLAIYISIYLSVDLQLRKTKVDTLIFCHALSNPPFLSFKKKSDMTREVTWWLRTQVALTEGLSPVWNTYMAVHNCL